MQVQTHFTQRLFLLLVLGALALCRVYLKADEEGAPPDEPPVSVPAE